VKIYTRAGDEGETGLFGGLRVPKHDLRIQSYGIVDELNACLGLCAEAAPASTSEILRREMSRLFDLGAHLATPGDAKSEIKSKLPFWDDHCLTLLEGEIDTREGELEPLKTFVLPGGCELSARLHLARTICRRAERNLSRLMGREPVDERFAAYLNRLSDWLFVLARTANAEAGVPDVPWTPARGG